MNKENSSNQKKNNNFLAAAVSLILSAALFAIDLFLFLNQPRNMIGIIGTSLLMLIWIYFFVRSIFQELEQNKQVMISYLEAMLKSEKAFFLMQRKVLNEMQQFGEDAKLPSEEIITAQKAIAKVTINRSRENTDALMNSNNQLLDRLADFEDKLSSFHTDIPAPAPAPAPMPELVAKPDPLIENSVRDILAEQRTIVENIQRMEAAIKDEVLKAVSSINEMQSKMPVYVQEPVRQEVVREVSPMEAMPMSSDIGSTEEISMEAMPMNSDIGTPEDIVVDGDIGAPEDIVVDGDIGAPEDIVIDSDLGGISLASGNVEVPAPEEEELPDLDSLLSSIEDLGIGTEIPETISEPIAEPEPIPEPEPIREPEPEPIPEPIPEPEPVAEEKPVMPDLSNPSKMMTPDEIAALLANM